MPKARSVLNGFTAAEMREITGLSLPMIDYLLRMGFLRPAYIRKDACRGRVRFYSYRDLVAARLVQRLREKGVQLGKLKAAVQKVAQDKSWIAETDPSKRLSWLVSDGHEVLFKNEDGFLDSMRSDGQRAFAFVVNLGNLADEVRAKLTEPQSLHFTLENRPLRYA
jgi:DNA-binding transcriptional MerR regulator